MNRRKGSWDQTLEDFVKVEFHTKDALIDTRLSVYEVEEERIIQVGAEHGAANALDPRTLRHFPLGGQNVTVEACPDPYFSFRRAAHRVIEFDEEVHVVKLAKDLLDRFKGGQQETFLVKTEQVKAYAKARHEAGDEEWLRFAQHPKASSWGLKQTA